MAHCSHHDNRYNRKTRNHNLQLEGMEEIMNEHNKKKKIKTRKEFQSKNKLKQQQ